VILREINCDCDSSTRFGERARERKERKGKIKENRKKYGDDQT
jgi:hypothetical protein